MKKLLIILLFTLIITGCSSKTTNTVDKTINEDDIRHICELATLDVKFNNIVKCINEQPFTILGKTVVKNAFKSQAWAEYQGNVQVGIDMKQVNVSFDESLNKIIITLPKAKVIGEPTDNISEIQDEFFHYSNGWVSQNIGAKITPEMKQKGISEAKQNMIASIEGNDTILAQAQNRAKNLIENFIYQNGEYEIEWILN